MRRIASAAAVAALMLVGAAGAAEAKPLRAEAAGPQPNADMHYFIAPSEFGSTIDPQDSAGSTDGTNWD